MRLRSSAVSKGNIPTNTKSFATKFRHAAPRLRVQSKKRDAGVEIGLPHREAGGKCLMDFMRQSERNTDAVFGLRSDTVREPINYASQPQKC